MLSRYDNFLCEAVQREQNYTHPSQPPLRYLPGQYVDLHVPNIPVVGGFTITSPPQTALRLPAPTPSTTSPPTAATFDDPYIELAIQSSPGNPPAAYLWKEPTEIMNAPVQFRVGGNFTYPPMELNRGEFARIDNVVFLAGGVGVNPIMSMIGAMDLTGAGRLGGMVPRVRVLYTSRREAGDNKNGQNVQEVLFEKRLAMIAKKWSQQKNVDFDYKFFETSGKQSQDNENQAIQTVNRRMSHDDLFEALGPEEKRQNALVYICGVPSMTDEFVELLSKAPRMEARRVLCEKWW